MITHLLNTRRRIPLSITHSLLRQLTNILHRYHIRTFTRMRSLTHLSLSINHLTAHTTQKLISRSPHIQRHRTLTKLTNNRRRNTRTNNLTSTRHTSHQLRRLRHIMSHRPNNSQTTKTISMRISILIQVLKLRRGRLHSSRIHRMIISQTSRRRSTLLRRTQMSIMNTLPTKHLFSSRQSRIRILSRPKLQV